LTLPDPIATVAAMPLSAVIVDDHPLARRRLRTLLREHHDVTLAGEAGDAASALALIRETRPQLVFLDVQMPGDDGFEVVRQIPEDERPLFVFITAYEQYAFNAFRASAVQYLLKPVDAGELGAAVGRARQLAGGDGNAPDAAALTTLLQELRRARAASNKVMVKTNGRTKMFDIKQIDWLEAAGNYVRLHIGGDHYLVRESMTGIEDRLDPRTFVRVHRSAIVNVERIREFHATTHGDFQVLLRDGSAVPLSRAYRDRFEFALGQL
jgi:two-component system, LytTR family, response regulator